jgi:DNA polymerase-3 subunit delta
MVYCYFGPDIGVSEAKAKNDIRASQKGDSPDVLSYDGYNCLVQDAVAEASSLSLFGDRKTILFTNAYFLSTSEKKTKGTIKESDQDYKGLISYLHNPEPSSDLYFITEGNLDSKNEAVLAMKEEAASFVNCTEMSEDDFVSLAFQKAKSEGKEIEREAASLLFDRTSTKVYGKAHGNYLLFLNELDKLLTYSEKVSLEDVRLLVQKPLEDNLFEIVSDLLLKKTGPALRVYQDLRKAGSLPLQILPAMASQFRFMALVKYQMENGNQNEESIAREIGNTTKGRIYYTKKEIRYVSYKTFLEILADLGEIEVGMKKKQDNGDQQMELFLLTFQERYLR